MPKVKSHLDFEKKSQLIQVTIQKVASLPAGWAGGLVYLTADDGDFSANTLCYYNGTAWIGIYNTTALLTEVTGGGGITVTVDGTTRKVSVTPDNSTVELSDDTDAATVQVKDKGITFAKIQDIPTMTVVGRIDSDSGVSSAIDILGDITGTLTADQLKSLASVQAIKDYVAEVVTGIGVLQGGWDADTQSVFPTRSVGDTKKGDYWYVTVAGTIQTVAFNIGDVIIANVDSPTNTDLNDYTFLEVNRDQATETVLGVSRIATQVEVNAGANDTAYVTPLKLKTLFADNSYLKYVSGNLGNGVLTTLTVNHNLNTANPSWNVRLVATNEEIIVDGSVTDADNIAISFADAPATGTIKVIVRK